MANMQFTSEGLLFVLANALFDVSGIYDEDWWIELFQSNTTVSYGSVIGDFTLASFSGYAHVSYTRADMIGCETTSGNQVRTKGLLVPTFTCTGGSPQTVYGWLAVGKTSGKVWFGANFDAPRVMSSGAKEELDPFRIYCQTLH